MKLKHRLLAVVIVLTVVALGYVVASRLIDTTTKGDSSAEKVLTIEDIDKPSVVLDSEISDDSVESLTKQLKGKINEQIAAKQNPFETVYQLADVLANTTNKSRQDQLTDFLEEFLAKRGDALWFESESEMPDQAQVNYWESKLYAKLVYNYQFMILNKFTDSDGNLIDTTKQQLKYTELYLKLAYDPESHSRATEEYKHAPLGYTYSATDDFSKLRNGLMGR